MPFLSLPMHPGSIGSCGSPCSLGVEDVKFTFTPIKQLWCLQLSGAILWKTCRQLKADSACRWGILAHSIRFQVTASRDNQSCRCLGRKGQVLGPDAIVLAGENPTRLQQTVKFTSGSKWSYHTLRGFFAQQIDSSIFSPNILGCFSVGRLVCFFHVWPFVLLAGGLHSIHLMVTCRPFQTKSFCQSVREGIGQVPCQVPWSSTLAEAGSSMSRAARACAFMREWASLFSSAAIATNSSRVKTIAFGWDASADSPPTSASDCMAYSVGARRSSKGTSAGRLADSAAASTLLASCMSGAKLLGTLEVENAWKCKGWGCGFTLRCMNIIMAAQQTRTSRNLWIWACHCPTWRRRRWTRLQSGCKFTTWQRQRNRRFSFCNRWRCWILWCRLIQLGSLMRLKSTRCDVSQRNFHWLFNGTYPGFSWNLFHRWSHSHVLQRTFGQLTLETHKSIGVAFFRHKQGRPMPSFQQQFPFAHWPLRVVFAFTPKVSRCRWSQSRGSWPGNFSTPNGSGKMERLAIATFAVSRRARRRARCGTASMRPCSDKPDHSRLLSPGLLVLVSLQLHSHHGCRQWSPHGLLQPCRKRCQRSASSPRWLSSTSECFFLARKHQFCHGQKASKSWLISSLAWSATRTRGGPKIGHHISRRKQMTSSVEWLGSRRAIWKRVAQSTTWTTLYVRSWTSKTSTKSKWTWSPVLRGVGSDAGRLDFGGRCSAQKSHCGLSQLRQLQLSPS